MSDILPVGKPASPPRSLSWSHYAPFFLSSHHLRGRRSLGASRSAVSESIGEAARNGLEVSHASSARRLPSLGLLAPVVCGLLILSMLDTLNVVGRTLAGLSSRVAARGTGVLLNVERAASCVRVVSVEFRPCCPSRHPVKDHRHIPQRRQSVCVLLWRLPKLEVPFAVSRSASLPCGCAEALALHTHDGLGTATRLLFARSREDCNGTYLSLLVSSMMIEERGRSASQFVRPWRLACNRGRGFSCPV